MEKSRKDINCPICKTNLGVDKGIDHNHKPSNGDISICSYCYSILVFDNNNKRTPTEEELIEFKSDPELWNEIHKAIYIAKELN